MSDPLTEAAAAAGKPYGMTAEQFLQRMVMGDVPHPDADPEHCGATDPREDQMWCAEDKGHAGDHNNFRADDTTDSFWRRFRLGPYAERQ